MVEKDKTPLGFIETKDLKADLDKLEKDNQLQRYFEAIGNVIITNYLEFRWYIKQENQTKTDKGRLLPVLTINIGTLEGNKIKPAPNAEIQLRQMLKNFVEAKVASVKDPKDLASRLSSIAILIRDSITEVFSDDDLLEERRTLELQLNAFKENLISDLEVPQFADMYAQTICYGLFSAKIAINEKPLSWESAAYALPSTNPFLKKIFNEFTQELPKSVKKHVDLVVNLLNHTDMESVLSGFGKGSARDPIFHFYETFLSEYNPKEKEHRGVYYTPEPVVSYIVRSVDIILKEKFGMAKGLADSDKITLPDGKQTHRLIILDPATGTGTFLYSVLGKIFDNLKYGKMGRIGKSEVDSIDKDILSRIYGFELMMAPYTIAHMKLGLLLQEKGYAGESRLNIYLTNTLDRHHENIVTLKGGGFERVIATESMEASKAKTSLPIMVVIGNPPYSGHSANKIPWMDRLMRGHDDTAPDIHEMKENTANYFKVDGKDLGERNPKWLNDDYVKFIRWGQWRIEKTGAGVLAFITNHGYLDNPTFRGMRQSLLETFNEIYVLDLHGNAKKKEACADGSKDENVFDIQQGVSIGLFVKLPKIENPPTPLNNGGGKEDASLDKGGARRAEGSVFHADLYGLREVFENKTLAGGKYHWLLDNDIRKTEWKHVNPAKPFYMFIPTSMDANDDYKNWPSVVELMPVNSVGIVTARDSFVFDYSEKTLEFRIKDFMLSKLDEEEVRRKYLSKNDKLDIHSIKKEFSDKNISKYIHKCLYRPFDTRSLFYFDSIIERSRSEVMRHMLAGENIGLITVRKVPPSMPCGYFMVTRHIISNGVIRSDNQSIDGLYPLYSYPDPNPAKLNFETSPWSEGKNGRRPNLDKKIVDKIASDLGLTFIPDGSSASLDKGGARRAEGSLAFGPEDLFNYIYAVLHSPTYRTRYADFLKYDFPRVPFVKDPDLFRELAILGQKLSSLHLLEDPELEDFSITFHQVDDDPVVESVSYDNGNVKINKNEYFEGIPQNVWEFMVGGYQVAQKWLKDRKGRTLSHEDRLTYAKIMTALEKTIGIMEDIDSISDRIFPD